jgi:hypothetical protein
MQQWCREVMILKTDFYEELKQFFVNIFISSVRKFFYEILIQGWGRKYFQTDECE